MKRLKIESLSSLPLLLAPMAGVTDTSFRRLARSMGAGILYSEMVSAKGVLYGSAKTRELLYFEEEERPFGIQLFGDNSREVARAAAQVEAKFSPDLIDINMGCPVPKVVKSGAGSALMRNPSRAVEMAARVVEEVQLPVTVKMRTGWDQDNLNATRLSVQLEEVGISALAVHGRTRDQFYEGRADWGIIRAVKEEISIPVIGSGDLLTPQKIKSFFDETGCDAVMIARGARGNPWIFSRTLELLTAGTPGKKPSLEEVIRLTIKHLELQIKIKGEYRAVREMRKHCGWYLKGFPGVKALRQLINQVKKAKEFKSLLLEYLAYSTNSKDY